MKKQVIKFYYLLLAGFVVTQIAYTLFCGGSLLYTRGKISNLKQQEQQLKDQQVSLETDQSTQASLQELLQSDLLANYTDITQPVSIQSSSSLALETK